MEPSNQARENHRRVIFYGIWYEQEGGGIFDGQRLSRSGRGDLKGEAVDGKRERQPPNSRERSHFLLGQRSRVFCSSFHGPRLRISGPREEFGLN